MRRFKQQLLVSFLLLFCSFADAKPRISVGPDGEWVHPFDSYFGTLTGWNNSEADPGESGSYDEPDYLEETSKTAMKSQPTTNYNQPIRFPGQSTIQPIEFPNQESTSDIQPTRFPGPTRKKQTKNNNEPIKFLGPTNKRPTANDNPKKFSWSNKSSSCNH